MKRYSCKQLNLKLTIEEAREKKDLPCHGCVWSHQCVIPIVVAINIEFQYVKKCGDDFRKKILDDSKVMTQLEGVEKEMRTEKRGG